MRSHFEQQLELLNRNLMEMGALCEEAIVLAARAMTYSNEGEAARIAEVDARIDKLERSIESLCMRLLLRQQPEEQDLRVVSAALKMITDMERIGDQAADIAEILPFLEGHVSDSCFQLREMGQAASRMVGAAVDAYVNRNVEGARDVQEMDDIVDQHFREIKADLIRLIADDPAEGEYAMDLLMIAKYFERIGDHATNIAEWAVFTVTGEKENLE